MADDYQGVLKGLASLNSGLDSAGRLNAQSYLMSNLQEGQMIIPADVLKAHPELQSSLNQILSSHDMNSNQFLVGDEGMRYTGFGPQIHLGSGWSTGSSAYGPYSGGTTDVNFQDAFAGSNLQNNLVPSDQTPLPPQRPTDVSSTLADLPDRNSQPVNHIDTQNENYKFDQSEPTSQVLNTGFKTQPDVVVEQPISTDFGDVHVLPPDPRSNYTFFNVHPDPTTNFIQTAQDTGDQALNLGDQSKYTYQPVTTDPAGGVKISFLDPSELTPEERASVNQTFAAMQSNTQKPTFEQNPLLIQPDLGYENNTFNQNNTPTTFSLTQTDTTSPKTDQQPTDEVIKNEPVVERSWEVAKTPDFLQATDEAQAQEWEDYHQRVLENAKGIANWVDTLSGTNLTQTAMDAISKALQDKQNENVELAKDLLKDPLIKASLDKDQKTIDAFIDAYKGNNPLTKTVVDTTTDGTDKGKVPVVDTTTDGTGKGKGPGDGTDDGTGKGKGPGDGTDDGTGKGKGNGPGDGTDDSSKTPPKDIIINAKEPYQEPKIVSLGTNTTKTVSPVKYDVSKFLGSLGKPTPTTSVYKSHPISAAPTQLGIGQFYKPYFPLLPYQRDYQRDYT